MQHGRIEKWNNKIKIEALNYQGLLSKRKNWTWKTNSNWKKLQIWRHPDWTHEQNNVKITAYQLEWDERNQIDTNIKKSEKSKLHNMYESIFSQDFYIEPKTNLWGEETPT